MCLRAYGVKTWHDVTGGVKCCAVRAEQRRTSTREWVDEFYSPRLTQMQGDTGTGVNLGAEPEVSSLTS